VWFGEQSAEALADAMARFEAGAAQLSPAAARRQALRYSRRRYREQLVAYLGGVLAGWPEARRAA
jgi:hypothetical protein